MLSLLTNSAAAGVAQRLDAAGTRLERLAIRLASGRRINSARDDAAGLAIVSHLEAQRRGGGVELRNLNDLGSLLQVADSALGNIAGNLQRLRELAVQAASDIYRPADRLALQVEADQLYELSRSIQAQTEFNGARILDGSFHAAGAGGAGGLLPGFGIPAIFLPRTTDILFRLVQFTQASTQTQAGSALGSGDLVLNGQAIAASLAGPQPGQAASSAWALARAINQAGIADLTAVAEAAVTTGDSVALVNGGLVAAGQISINGVPVGAGNVVAAINAVAGQSGVTATLSASGVIPGSPPQPLSRLTLSAADGRDIDVAGAAAFGLDDRHVAGQLRITGPLAENGNLVIAGNNPGAAGLVAGVIAGQAVGDPVSVPLTEAEGFDLHPDMRSSNGAQATLAAMDRKLERLNSLRAQLGALANRLEIRAATLAVANETGAASAARIADADYAQEMAAMTRERMLRQVGLTLSVQANAEPRRVLGLLRSSGLRNR